MEGRREAWEGSAGCAEVAVEGNPCQERAEEGGCHSVGRAATWDQRAVEAAKQLAD